MMSTPANLLRELIKRTQATFTHRVTFHLRIVLEVFASMQVDWEIICAIRNSREIIRTSQSRLVLKPEVNY